EDEGEEARLVAADLDRLGVLSRGDEVADLVAEARRNQLALADAERIFKHQVGRGERSANQRQHDDDADGTAGEQNLEEALRRFAGRLRGSGSSFWSSRWFCCRSFLLSEGGAAREQVP